jgi:hypothetical protein
LSVISSSYKINHNAYPTEALGTVSFGMAEIGTRGVLDAVDWAVLGLRYEAGERAGDIAAEINQTKHYVQFKLRGLSSRPDEEKKAVLDEAWRRKVFEMEALFLSGKHKEAAALARSFKLVVNTSRYLEEMMDHEGSVAPIRTEMAVLSDAEFERLKNRLERRAILIHEPGPKAGISEAG